MTRKTGETGEKAAKPAVKRDTDRARRQGEALRANLRRRRAQAQAQAQVQEKVEHEDTPHHQDE